jgi:phosphatidylserine/phosphatidylglycerophosphate/cardiolipin synthase-like enzyme
MSNLIVRAEREVYLATNYWQNSIASKFLTDAMKELSRRAGMKGTKIVMKIIYDRGSPRQVVEPHFLVTEKTYTGTAVGLPHPHEIPHIDLEVVNYHQPMLGTFHAKYMVVDRKIAVLQSNNIQDNDNVEMMVHLEGPIVDSLYDMALISWRLRLAPPLPSHDTPAAQRGVTGSSQQASIERSVTFGNGNTREARVVDSSTLVHADDTKQEHGPTKLLSTDSATNDEGVTAQHTIGDGVDGTSRERTRATPRTTGVIGEEITRYLGVSQQQIANPTARAQPLAEHTTDDPHWDDDIAAEVARVQASVSGATPEATMEAIARHLNHTTNRGFEGSAPPHPPGEEMTPYILHGAHEVFPMALVNRPPYGPPNNKSVSNPQNAVWLSALRNAQRNVFIQTPTLNAEPLVPAIVEACERGIEVFCYVCLGYNDTVSPARYP